MARKNQNQTKAMQAVPEPAREELKRETIKSPDFFSIYTNDVQVQTSPWDMRLVLGESAPPEDATSAISIKQLGELRMSPQLAKQLIRIMLDQVKRYEERFGKIPALT
jgi:Protein of unknown function (DUF3467)